MNICLEFEIGERVKIVDESDVVGGGITCRVVSVTVFGFNRFTYHVEWFVDHVMHSGSFMAWQLVSLDEEAAERRRRGFSVKAVFLQKTVEKKIRYGAKPNVEGEDLKPKTT